MNWYHVIYFWIYQFYKKGDQDPLFPKYQAAFVVAFSTGFYCVSVLLLASRNVKIAEEHKRLFYYSLFIVLAISHQIYFLSNKRFQKIHDQWHAKAFEHAKGKWVAYSYCIFSFFTFVLAVLIS